MTCVPYKKNIKSIKEYNKNIYILGGGWTTPKLARGGGRTIPNDLGVIRQQFSSKF
jgi:hypothetical protein